MLQYHHWRTEQEIVVAAGQGGGRDLGRTAAIDKVVSPWPGGVIFIPHGL